MAIAASKSDIELKNVEFESSEDIEVVPTFQAMKLREELLRGIYAYGEKTIFSQIFRSYMDFVDIFSRF